MTANPNCLTSEVQYPVAECSIQAQNAKFMNQFHGGDCVECEFKSTNSILMWVLLFSRCVKIEWRALWICILCKLVRVQAGWDVVFDVLMHFIRTGVSATGQ